MRIEQTIEQMLEQIHTLTDIALTQYDETCTLTVKNAIQYIIEIDNIAFKIEETL